jgi:hypothetical protein
VVWIWAWCCGDKHATHPMVTHTHMTQRMHAYILKVSTHVVVGERGLSPSHRRSPQASPTETCGTCTIHVHNVHNMLAYAGNARHIA